MSPNQKKLMTLILMVHASVFATPTNVTQTQSKISTLTQQIQGLKQSLQEGHLKKKNLMASLKSTDEKIGELIKAIHLLEKDIALKEKDIRRLESQMISLTQALHNEQSELEKQIIARYKMGEHQPLKWFLNQESPLQYQRLLRFYQGVIESRVTLMEKIKIHQSELIQSESALTQTLKTKKRLRNQLAQKHQVLLKEKAKEKAIVASINARLNHHSQTLARVQKNREILEALLKEFTQKASRQPKVAINRSPKSLNRPVTILKTKPYAQNHGLFYPAKEGSPVLAISPGKVVFSEWLNGYGLIMIIDHGDGFMSLYANNQALYKRKGESVSKGEQIATVGHSGGKRENGLYFELRHKGKSVSAQQWMG